MDHNILAIELCLRLESGSDLRTRLKDLVLGHPSASSPGLKWELLRRLTELLVEHEHLFVKGCWDFFDDDARAQKDYDMWSKGMITEEGARAEASGWPGHGGDEVRYMTFTIALLLKGGTRCATDLARLCDIPEARLWERASFVRILKGLSRVSYAAVKSDVLYLIPGHETWGLTAADLELPKFEYLRPIA
jgi:hypothetical protein